MLTHERLQELLHYNPLTGVFKWAIPRPGTRAGTIAGAIHHSGYVHIQVDGMMYTAHRLAWFYMTGSWPVDEIDHKDRVRGNNVFDNLREATGLENKQNKGMAHSNKVGLLGVCKNGSGFMATIRLNKKQRYLGTFKTPELAHQAYLIAKRKLHEFGTI